MLIKKHSYEISFFFVFVTAIIGETNAQFKISSSGNIGIGTTNPQYKLDVEGTARFSGWTDLILDWGAMYGSPQLYPEKDWYLFIGKPNNRIGHFYVVDVHYTNLYKVSDSRLKHDVVPLKSSLSQIRKVTAVRYKLNEDTKRSSLSKTEPTRKDLSKKEYLGFIAQDLRKIFPELVETNEDGYLKVDYISMIPILVEAFNEQQEIVDAQSAKIKELDAKISKLENDKVGGKKEIQQNLTGEISLVKNSYLYQNTPNPFSLSP